jgi:hypothetical protein
MKPPGTNQVLILLSKQMINDSHMSYRIVLTVQFREVLLTVMQFISVDIYLESVTTTNVL